MSRVVVVVDGEHYPPVVRGALAALAAEHDVVAAVFAGGTEKVGSSAGQDAYGIPVVHGDDVESALADCLGRYGAETVVDLSDEPVLSTDDRFRLAGVALGLGVAYRGADFSFEPQARVRRMATPTLAVVGTGKRVGKTAVSAHVARMLKAGGRDVAVLAMGRGGPETPEVIRGEQVTLATPDLLALARAGAHAASDNYEDAVMARVTTIGCRRCGGGMAGAVAFGNVTEGAGVADGLGKELIILEGSGSAVPPVEADATVLVVGANQGARYVTDYFGPMRVRASDLVVVAGAEEPVASRADTEAVFGAVRDVGADRPVVAVTFRPEPIEDIAGRRVFFATTAIPALLPSLKSHLETQHGCKVVGASPHLSDRGRLREDLSAAAGTFDLLLTELKAAAVDVVAEAGEIAGVPTVLCDNVPLAVEGDLDGQIERVAALALQRGLRGAEERVSS